MTAVTDLGTGVSIHLQTPHAGGLQAVVVMPDGLERSAAAPMAAYRADVSHGRTRPHPFGPAFEVMESDLHARP